MIDGDALNLLAAQLERYAARLGRVETKLSDVDAGLAKLMQHVEDESEARKADAAARDRSLTNITRIATGVAIIIFATAVAQLFGLTG